MSEMAQTADQLLVIGRGRILSSGPVDDVIASATTDRVRVASPQATELAELLAQRDLATRAVEPGVLETTAATAAAIGETAAAAGIVLHELTTIHASLEEAYLTLTGDSVEYRTDSAHRDAPRRAAQRGPSEGAPRDGDR
jgi:ABC-type multidrug transport system, ATPase component